jgi:hypothetical protein
MKRPELNKINLKEDKYRKSDKHPSHKGVVDIDGTYYWVSGWFNDGEWGTYFKGDFKAVTNEEMAKYFSDEPQSVPAAKPVSRPRPVMVDDDISDELPF